MLNLKVGTPFAKMCSMNITSMTSLTKCDSINARRVLYGLELIVVLSLLYATHLTNDSYPYIPLYLSLAAVSLLVLFWAGVEYTLNQTQVIAAQASQRTTREQAEHMAEDRQRSFNHIWQDLADNRNSAEVPSSVLKDLAMLFEADLVAVWGADKADGYHLHGSSELQQEHLLRLEKVSQSSPCFDPLRKYQRQMLVTDISAQTTKPFAWFCEELEFRQVMLCPVLVRQNVVGVLGFFYCQDPRLCARQREEMQLAANLFLCAL